MIPTGKIFYTKDDSERARKEWKASCGHHSIAAACGVTLDAVKAAVPHHKGWMNPTNIGDTLRNLGVEYQLTKGLKRIEFCQGINRIQFEGAWLDKGKPVAAAYFHTHWITLCGAKILDTVIHPFCWLDFGRWLGAIEEYSKEAPCTGYHVTHWYRLTYNEPAAAPVVKP